MFIGGGKASGAAAAAAAGGGGTTRCCVFDVVAFRCRFYYLTFDLFL